jgi:UDPglucose 6-dehydrogenase
MFISIVGTGYVGLVSGVCFAAKGHQVTCVDVDPAKVDKINASIPPIHEKGLAELLKANIGHTLRATTDLRQAVLDSEVSIIAVGTPFDGSAIDLTHIRAASRQIGQVLRDKTAFHVVVVKSTVVPGTTDEVVLPELEAASGKRAGVDFGVGMNPEFLREGEAVQDFMQPDRIVLGGINERTIEVLESVYAVFSGVDKIRTRNKTAEMIKYASNSLLATMISFSNEIGNLCADLGDIDVTEVMKGVHLDKRISPILPDGRRVVPALTTYLEAGCGFGGSCFPKDVRALIAHGAKAGRQMRVLDAVIQVNERQPDEVLRLLSKHFDSFAGLRVAVVGLAFKPGTDDMRESPAIRVVRALQAAGSRMSLYDPVARHEAEKLFGRDGIVYCEDLAGTVRDVDAIVVLTRWPEFEQLPELLEASGSNAVVIDGRRMLERRRFSRYEGIGL